MTWKVEPCSVCGKPSPLPEKCSLCALPTCGMCLTERHCKSCIANGRCDLESFREGTGRFAGGVPTGWKVFEYVLLFADSTHGPNLDLGYFPGPAEMTQPDLCGYMDEEDFIPVERFVQHLVDLQLLQVSSTANIWETRFRWQRDDCFIEFGIGPLDVFEPSPKILGEVDVDYRCTLFDLLWLNTRIRRHEPAFRLRVYDAEEHGDIWPESFFYEQRILQRIQVGLTASEDDIRAGAEECQRNCELILRESGNDR